MKYLTLMVFSVCIAGSMSFGSEGVDDVIKLQKAGITIEVVQAYVQDSPVAYDLSADDIQQLEDANVPATVIVSMLDHGKQLRNEPGAEPAQAVAAAEPVVSAEVDVVAPPADKADISLFYEAMAPYGAWSQDETNGWLWEPRDGADANWRPYANNGHWDWTDHGWYWESSSPYGWAAYHYGRWGYNSHNRWSWSPDNVWGPAWVDWRQSDENIGWAPLPFGSRFDADLGFTFHGNRVGFDFHAGLEERDYCFVQSDRFLDANIGIVLIPENRRHDVYNRTTVIKNTYVYNDNRIMNNGVSATIVARATRRQIEPMKVVDANIAAGQPIRGERRDANTIVAYRPKLANTAAVAPTAFAERQKASATRANAATVRKVDNQAAQEAARNRLAAEKLQRKNAPAEQKAAAKAPIVANKPAAPTAAEAERQVRAEAQAAKNREPKESQPATAKPVAQPRAAPAESEAQREERTESQAEKNREAKESQPAKPVAQPRAAPVPAAPSAAEQKQNANKEAAAERKNAATAAAADKREEAAESKEEKALEKKEGK